MATIDENGLALDPSNRPQTTTRWHLSVQRVLVHMRDHLDEKQSSEELADIAALSRFHFNRVFRQVTGIPPAHFRTALRLERAKSLLLTSELSVTEVCLEVGYTSLGTFVSRFSASVGMSPRALRRTAHMIYGADLRHFCDGHSARSDRPRKHGSIEGRVQAPADFRGVICVGMYDALLPHSQPVRCASLETGGSFCFGGLRDGNYVVAAAALDPHVGPLTFLDRGVALRAASRPIAISDSRGAHSVDLVLRTAMAFDPPILAPLPAMLASRQAGRDEHLGNQRDMFRARAGGREGRATGAILG